MTEIEHIIPSFDQRVVKINEALLLYEEIFPMDVTELYIRYPNLEKIIEKSRNGRVSLTKKDFDILHLAMSDLRNTPSFLQLKKDIESAAKEIYNLLFPETGTELFVKFLTKQKNLDDTQQLFLAPAKGIERALGGMISLLNPATYTELKAGIRYITGQSLKTNITILKRMYENFEQYSTTKQSALGVEFIMSSIFLFGGVIKIGSLLGKYGSFGKIMTPTTFSQNNFRDFARLASIVKALD